MKEKEKRHKNIALPTLKKKPLHALNIKQAALISLLKCTLFCKTIYCSCVSFLMDSSVHYNVKYCISLVKRTPSSAGGAFQLQVFKDWEVLLQFSLETQLQTNGCLLCAKLICGQMFFCLLSLSWTTESLLYSHIHIKVIFNFLSSTLVYQM